MRYRVVWEMTYDAPTAEAAVRLAIDDLHEVVVTYTEGPTFFEVMDLSDASVRFVDTADAMFPLSGGAASDE